MRGFLFDPPHSSFVRLVAATHPQAVIAFSETSKSTGSGAHGGEKRAAFWKEEGKPARLWRWHVNNIRNMDLIQGEAATHGRENPLMHSDLSTLLP